MKDEITKPSQLLFILLGNGPIQNRGCEAILRSTTQLLRDKFGICHFINAPNTPIHPDDYKEKDISIKHLIPPKLKRWKWVWLKYRVNGIIPGFFREPVENYLPGAAAVLMIGGDNYSLDYGTPSRFFSLNRAVLKAGKPLVLWGASVGPFSKNPRFEAFAAKELKKISLILARESETIKYLAGIGVTENVRSVSDPAFTLEPEAVNEDLHLHFLKEQHIGINLSPLLSHYWHKEGTWLDLATECVSEVVKQVNLPVVLIPHVSYETNDDYAFMSKIKEHLGIKNDRVKLLPPLYNARQTKWIISKLTVFAGARTHATIAALSSGIPTISIGYSIKARGINKDIFGHCNWLIPFDNLRGSVLAGKVKEALKDESGVRQYLNKTMVSYKRKAEIAADYLRELIKDSSKQKQKI